MNSKRIIITLLFTLGTIIANAQNRDSLLHYIVIATENNPALKAEFLNYKASLEKIAQAGAFADPQLEMGLFIPQMEVLDGKQVADFRLMQMFPWFGTRKEARNEATEMARMSFEKFRSAKDNLILEVKTAWFDMANLKQKLTNIQENRELLGVLKELAINRFSAPGTSSTSSGTRGNPQTSAVQATSGGTMSSMGSMSSMKGGTSQSAVTQNSGESNSMSSMGSMGSMKGSSGRDMSSVLRVDIELAELESEEQSIIAQINSAKAKFNALLNRSLTTEITLPDSIVQTEYSINDETIMNSIVEQNPMLGMSTAQEAANNARLSMVKKMGLPMFGVGVQYSVLGKRDGSMIPFTHMNGQNMVMPMLSISIPIYRNKYKSQENESRFLREAAQQTYQSTLNTISSEYIFLKEQLSDFERKIRLYTNQERLALVTFQLALKEFSTGVSTMTDVIDIERQLLDYKYKKGEATANYNKLIAVIENLISEKYTE